VGAPGVAGAVAALGAGEPVLLPTDGVYGLCAATGREAVAALYALKGRGAEQPAAIVAASLAALAATVPELDPRSALIARTLLPGPFTLVVANPGRRYPWLCGSTPEAIGVRVARVPPATQAVLDEVGAVAATSANLPGEPAAASLEEVAPRLRAGCGAELDAGRLPGTASTVIDFTRPEPVVIRAGAGDPDAALAAVAAALAA
jgi:L-threonylcarbamoyladenylate synthase